MALMCVMCCQKCYAFSCAALRLMVGAFGHGFVCIACVIFFSKHFVIFYAFYLGWLIFVELLAQWYQCFGIKYATNHETSMNAVVFATNLYVRLIL